MIEVNTVHKKDVLIVLPPPFAVLGKRLYSNSAINVYGVSAHLSGKSGITVSTAASTGSSCGLLRAIPSGGFNKFLAIVLLHLMALRITGLNRYLTNKSIIPEYSICFTMQPTFTRTAAC